MLLEEHIGKRIEISIKPRDGRSSLFSNLLFGDMPLPYTLIAIDNIGVWVRETLRTVIIKDKYGAEINRDEWKERESTVNVLVKWEDIETIVAYEDPLLHYGQTEFCQLDENENVQDLY